MRNLLRTDMFRFLKSKQFLILSIICGIYSLAYPALIYLIQEFASMATGKAQQLMYAKQFSFSSFGLGIPLLLTIIMFTTVLANEFSYGTVRNKIIVGYSRTKIYLSLAITTLTFMFGIVFISSILSFGLAGILFYYDNLGGMFIYDIGYYLIGLVIALLIMAVYVSIVMLFTVGLNKTALSIIVPIILIFFSVIISTICDTFLLELSYQGLDTNFVDILTFIKCINIYYQSVKISELSLEYYEIIAFIIFPWLGAGLFTFLGLLAFNKKDIK